MKEHIDTLERYNTGKTVDIASLNAALRAAIELMNAAKPLDEAAESEHCFHAAERLTGYEWTAPRVSKEIESERAQARAEGYLKGQLVGIDMGAEDTQRRMQALLSAAQAEIHNLRIELSETIHMSDYDKLETKLSAAQAEIERLRGVYARQCGENDALETKLAAAQAEIASLKAWNAHVEKIAQLPASQDLVTLGLELAELRELKMSGLKALAHQECKELETKLSAAQAEIERLKASYAQAGSDYAHEAETRDALEAQLAAAQAERKTLMAIDEARVNKLQRTQTELSAAQAEIKTLHVDAGTLERLNVEAGNKLSAAQVELDQLRKDLADTHEWRRDLETKYLTAQIEIERLQKKSGVYRDAYNNAQTKLANLRSAAERHEATSENSGAPRWVEFRAAIEASR